MTFTYVARTTSIVILFALASIDNLRVQQMDIETEILKWALDEEAYVEL